MTDEPELLQDDDGALIMLASDTEGALEMGGEDLDCCDNCDIQPPLIICGDQSTCNHWCTGKAWIFRSGCCDCPCPGRKVFPECYKIDVLGVTIVERYNNEDGTYYTFDPTGPFDFEDAACVNTSYDVTWNLYAANGTFLNTGTGNVETESESASCISGCIPGAPSAPLIQVNASVTTGLPAGSSLLSQVDDAFGNCCIGASGDLIANDFTTVVDDGGRFVVTPRCVHCDGSPCTGGVDPPQVCGGTITITFEYDTGGGVFALATAEVNGGPCAWSGTADIGGNVSIKTNPVDNFGNPCCPDCDCEDCDGDCPEAGLSTDHCNGSCWLVTIAAAGHTDTIILDSRSCPSGYGPVSSTHFSNITLSAATGCR